MTVLVDSEYCVGLEIAGRLSDAERGALCISAVYAADV